MKNKIHDLRNHLFAQLERLSEEDIEPQKLEAEIKRSQAIVGVAETIINSAKVEVAFVAAGGSPDRTNQAFFIEGHGNN